MPKKRNKKPKQTEIALTGVGVEATDDKKLTELADAYTDEKDSKAASGTKMKELEAEILNRMHILKLQFYRVENKLFRLTTAERIKVVKVKEKQIEALDEADAAGA